jgi:hypothetical protein
LNIIIRINQNIAAGLRGSAEGPISWRIRLPLARIRVSGVLSRQILSCTDKLSPPLNAIVLSIDRQTIGVL